MADNFLPYQNPTVTDAKLDTETLSVGANSVHRERVQIAGSGDVEIAKLANSNPAGTEYGLITRNIPSGTQPVSAASLPLPTGAATGAKQDTGNTSLSSLDTKLPAKGQAAMAASTPVVIASDQSTVPVSAASLPLPTGAATGAKQDTGNTSVASIDTKTPALGQALAAASTPVVLPAAQITTLTPPTSIAVNNFPATQPISAASLPLPSTAATSTKQSDGTQKTQIVDPDGVTPLNLVSEGFTFADTKVGLLLSGREAGSGAAAIAHSLITDADGTLKVATKPLKALGYYAVGGNVAYTATTQNGIIFSFRWSDATRFAVILRVDVNVLCTAFTTAGIVERQLIAVRSFTASDTGGTALTPTSSNNKLRTSFGTSLAGDIRIGGFLSAGTGTADANPLSQTATWMAAVGTIIPQTNLLDSSEGVQYPLVLAQNEGFRIRLGAAETASTRQTFVRIVWAEVNAY
jgi:hypothetical protein